MRRPTLPLPSSRALARAAALPATALLLATSQVAMPVAHAATTAATSGNLLKNAGAEDTDHCTNNGTDTMAVNGWTIESGAPDVVCYGANDYPDVSSPGSPNRGNQFFAGGGAGDSALSQTVDVSAAHTAVDRGSVPFSLSGWLGGYWNQNDRVGMTATFLDADGEPLDSAVIDPVTNDDRGNRGGMLYRETTGDVPAGTRTIRVDLDFTWTSGKTTDGYADDLSLTIGTKLPIPKPPVTSANLLQDPGAEDVAECSTYGKDGMTVPGWTITSGEPNAVCYGAPDYPDASSPRSPDSGRQFFAGGGTGDSGLSQTVDVSAAHTAVDRGGVPFKLSGWLGGYWNQNDRVGMTATFLDADGDPIGSSVIDPVTNGDRGNKGGMLYRSATGDVPAGTRTIRVDLDFTWTSGNTTDGYADDLSLTIGANLPAPKLTAPVSRVPGFDHVFVVYLENQDYGDIIGNTSEAPYLNSLLDSGTSLTQSYATTHPSDPNYVALAAGALHGLYDNSIGSTRIDAPHIGNTVDAAGKTWKAYTEGANGNCDTTSHGDYWADQLPFNFFTSMRDDTSPSGYCAQHEQPLTRMFSDLKSTATTPNFAWFEANECHDMEGCGTSAGDGWLRDTLPALFDSPAWTQQKSLLIVTFDEGRSKSFGPGHPNQVPTLLLGSKGTVKAGYSSDERTDQYGLLRTVDRALGLQPLTNNDAYAATVNDAWTHPAAGSPASPVPFSVAPVVKAPRNRN
ncbi:alkaline phosphatase family protein [Kitasatospora sp. NPDC058965]|uniref:alkaline phosphatase family protein n=1 Tax=Kitasatospora sp. NPDC058965 TaxID=3346682 RepID=UPI0036A10000